MKIPTPKKSREYPLYIIGYFIVIGLTIFMYGVLFDILPSITSKGTYVAKRDCIDTAEIGRYDESSVCVEYGQTYYEPVGTALQNKLKSSFLVSGLVVLVLGGWGYYNTRKKEKITTLAKAQQKANGDVLSKDDK